MVLETKPAATPEVKDTLQELLTEPEGAENTPLEEIKDEKP